MRSSDARSHSSTGIGDAHRGGTGHDGHGQSSRGLGGAETPALKSISSRLDGAVSTVLIEASEPVAYLTSQPDPLTVLVDLRNVNAAGARRQAVADLLAPVERRRRRERDRARRRAGRARARAARSRRQASRPQLAQHDPGRGRSQRRIEQPAAAVRRCRRLRRWPPAAKRPPSRRRPRRRWRRSAPPRPSCARCVREDRRRLLGDARRQRPAARRECRRSEGPAAPRAARFPGVAAGSAPAVTNVKNDDVDRIRVATNSREPLITRVVIDLARKLPYTVEQIGEDLRVMFKRAVDDRRRGDAAAPAPRRRSREPVVKRRSPNRRRRAGCRRSRRHRDGRRRRRGRG